MRNSILNKDLLQVQVQLFKSKFEITVEAKKYD